MLEDNVRRAPVQGDGPYHISKERWPKETQVPGTMSWAEHLEVWEIYAAKHGRSQSAERIAQRCGFSYWEATNLLGRPLTTWMPR